MASRDAWDAPTEAGPTAGGGGAPPAGRNGATTDSDDRRGASRGAADAPEYAGPYRLLRRIGRGGMGAVFLAERADGQFERRVAVKLVKRGMDSEEILARFRRERQILASLRHRHIAALLDGGATADGRPYLVMEHVEGTPITRYCDERRATLAERLELFCHVCDAVWFAHRSLVVHRDLKPANVLVDGEGQVKLLDFGIAKLLTDEGDAGLTARRDGPAAVMTPEYASPEQVRGGPVTTAVDVYQLGLLLYELVSGHRAQRLADASLHELERVVCDHDPPRPSVAVTLRATVWRPDETLEDVTPAAVAAARGTTAEALHRRLRGDVDAIVGMALHKEPARRYPSVEAFAADVRRHLRQQPVLARRPGLRYRTLKLVRRHRASAAAAAAAVVAIAAAVAYFTLRIQAERDRARLEAAKASQSAALLESLFASWSPVGGDRQRLRPEDLLRLAVVTAERDGEQAAEQRAATLSLLGGLHTEVGAYAEADRLLTVALLAQEQSPRAVPLDLAATLGRRSRLLLQRGRLPAAEAAARRAVELYGEQLGAHAPATLRARTQLATVLYWRERFAEAERELRRVREGLGPELRDSPLHLDVERDLGYMLYHQGRIDEAVPLLEAPSSARGRPSVTSTGPRSSPPVSSARRTATRGGWRRRTRCSPRRSTPRRPSTARNTTRRTGRGWCTRCSRCARTAMPRPRRWPAGSSRRAPPSPTTRRRPRDCACSPASASTAATPRRPNGCCGARSPPTGTPTPRGTRTSATCSTASPGSPSRAAAATGPTSTGRPSPPTASASGTCRCSSPTGRTSWRRRRLPWATSRSARPSTGRRSTSTGASSRPGTRTSSAPSPASARRSSPAAIARRPSRCCARRVPSSTPAVRRRPGRERSRSSRTAGGPPPRPRRRPSALPAAPDPAVSPSPARGHGRRGRGSPSCPRSRGSARRGRPTGRTTAMNGTLVFDVPVRLFHWLLVAHFAAAFAVATLAGEESIAFAVHAMLGMVLMLLVVLRLVWGAVGTRWARFSGLDLRPAALRRYLTAVVSGGSGMGKPGHNPATSWFFVVILPVLAALGVTGLLTARGDGRFEEVHESLAWVALGLAALHVVGVLWHVLRTGDNVVASMVNGRRRGVDATAGIAADRTATGLLLLAITGAFAVLLFSQLDVPSRQLRLFGTTLTIGEVEGGEDLRDDAEESER